MDQEHVLPEPNEPVTPLEVRALIERFGERQAMAQVQPTVKDVAEALQVDSLTVGEMLYELRASGNQDEIRKRLDKLEAENVVLRERAQNATPFHSPFWDPNLRRPFMFAMIVSIIATTLAFGTGSHEWAKQFAATVLLFFPLFFVGRRMFRKGRS